MQSNSTLPPGWRIPTLDGARSRGIYVQFYDPCGRSIRVAASTLAEAPITCQACDGDFQAKNPG